MANQETSYLLSLNIDNYNWILEGKSLPMNPKETYEQAKRLREAGYDLSITKITFYSLAQPDRKEAITLEELEKIVSQGDVKPQKLQLSK